MSTLSSAELELAAFHEGRREILEACYREHFRAALRAVSGILPGPEQETVVHELFFRVLSNRELREKFQGGSLSAWLSTLARNQAVDYRRRWRREEPLE